MQRETRLPSQVCVRSVECQVCRLCPPLSLSPLHAEKGRGWQQTNGREPPAKSPNSLHSFCFVTLSPLAIRMCVCTCVSVCVSVTWLWLWELVGVIERVNWNMKHDCVTWGWPHLTCYFRELCVCVCARRPFKHMVYSSCTLKYLFCLSHCIHVCW